MNENQRDHHHAQLAAQSAAAALARKDALLRMAMEALEYHTAQTRPISGTTDAIAAIEAELKEPK